LQLENLAKELKRKQKDLKENSSGNMFQRARFSDLTKLISAKMGLLRAEAAEGKRGEVGGASGGAQILGV
jgi:hypothetical protein